MGSPARHRVLTTFIILAGASGCGDCCVGDTIALDPYRYSADVMLADFTPVTRSADAWVSQGTAVTANMILPTSMVTDTFSDVHANCLIFEGVTDWTSEEGLASVQLTSSMQSASSIYDGTRYVISGLTANPAFAADDTLVVTDPAAADTVAEVQAPQPMLDVADHLGEPAGLQTIFRAPAGAYDIVIVFVSGSSPTGSQSGAMCGYRPDEAGGDDTWDEFTLVPPDVDQELSARGIMPASVSVAYHNEEISSSIFQEDIAVHAGRMLQIQYADLLP